jgi:hypothetical protein
VNDRPKVLEEFLGENRACSTLAVPRLETLIRAKRMLELHSEIVEQLVIPYLPCLLFLACSIPNCYSPGVRSAR